MMPLWRDLIDVVVDWHCTCILPAATANSLEPPEVPASALEPVYPRPLSRGFEKEIG